MAGCEGAFGAASNGGIPRCHWYAIPCKDEALLETVKAKVEEVLGVQDGAQQIWRPSICTIDKSAALRNALCGVFENTKPSVCMFHGHRAIHSHIRGLLPNSPIVSTLDGKRLPYSRTTAGVRIINAFKGLKMSRDAGELLEKKEKLYENLFPQLMSNGIAVRLKEYFEQHWFDANTDGTWKSDAPVDGKLTATSNEDRAFM
jgi:hypothetical protein